MTEQTRENTPNFTENPQIRLQKFIADAGVTSRRKAEDMILEGRVEVNGEIVRKLGTKVDSQQDVVFVDGTVVDPQQVEKMYLVMNKPRGYVTTVNDPEGRRTVLDLCKEISERIYPVGRLDYLSEGLLILTNDGEFANMVMHPRYEVEKVYEVKVFGLVDASLLRALQQGVQLDEGFARPQSVRVLKHLQNKTWLEFRLKEGRNREIRRICEAAGLTVDKLKRVAIGELSIDGISPGSFDLYNKGQLLKKMGLGKDGKVKRQAHYKSAKRSVNMRKKNLKAGTRADAEVFKIYRRESYFSTIAALKKKREEEKNSPKPTK